MKSCKLAGLVLLLCVGMSAQTASQFVPINPCRILDTRGGSALVAGLNTLDIRGLAATNCRLNLSAATAYSINVTLVPQNGNPVNIVNVASDDTLQAPLASLMNSYDGRIKANAAIIPAGLDGGIHMWLTNTADVVLDINGYFRLPGPQTLAYYPLPPCRIVDTRETGNPMTAGETRTISLLASQCLQGIGKPIAYSLNFTVVPYPSGNPLSYLTVWPSDAGPLPDVSTLNNYTATNVANAAIVRGSIVSAAHYGEINVYATDSTQLVIDINGYFGLPVSMAGASYFPASPCRILDTRTDPFGGTMVVDVKNQPGQCPSWTPVSGYVLNATVTPTPSFTYLSVYKNIFEGTETEPPTSTVNAIDGEVASNMAIVPTVDGTINAYAFGNTDLVLDAYGYFARSR
jgi:hypothetical protein